MFMVSHWESLAVMQLSRVPDGHSTADFSHFFRGGRCSVMPIVLRQRGGRGVHLQGGGLEKGRLWNSLKWINERNRRSQNEQADGLFLFFRWKDEFCLMAMQSRYSHLEAPVPCFLCCWGQMDPCPVVSCCLQVGWAVWRVHRQGQDAVHTGIPESFSFLLEQGVKYSGALIPPTLRGLRHYIALHLCSSVSPWSCSRKRWHSTPAFLGWVDCRVHSDRFLIRFLNESWKAALQSFLFGAFFSDIQTKTKLVTVLHLCGMASTFMLDISGWTFPVGNLLDFYRMKDWRLKWLDVLCPPASAKQQHLPLLRAQTHEGVKYSDCWYLPVSFLEESSSIFRFQRCQKLVIFHEYFIEEKEHFWKTTLKINMLSHPPS